MKKFLKILALTITILMISIPVFASESLITSSYFDSLYDTSYANSLTNNTIRVQLNGENLDFTDENGFKVEPQIINDRTMVPMRKIFEVFGANVEWIGETRTIKANTEDLEIGLQIDNKLATVKNKSGEVTEITLDSAPVIVNDRTLVPVRFIAESLDKKVGWDAYNRAVIIIDTNFIEEILKEDSSILYEYLTTDFEKLETYEMKINLNGKLKLDYGEEKNTLNLDGSMDFKLSDTAISMNIDLELDGTGILRESLKAENLENISFDLIMDLKNATIYIKSPLIEEYENKWIKYKIEDVDTEELTAMLEILKSQEVDGMQTLVDTLVQEDYLTLSSYEEIKYFVQMIAKIIGNENFKVSGTSTNKTYTYNIDLEDLLEILMSEIDTEELKMIEESLAFEMNMEVEIEDKVAKESNVEIDFAIEEDKEKIALELKAESKLKRYNQNITIQIPTGKNIIDGNQKEQEEREKVVRHAQFAGFISEMGDLQDSVKVAMLTNKGDEAIRGNNRTDAQLYNFVARGGYSAVSENDWLSREDALNIPCTKIDATYTKEAIGIMLPTRKVITHNGESVQLSYYVTPKGSVFCWPPFEYDGKSYVNANTTVKDSSGNELSNGKALKEKEMIIKFNNSEVLNVLNKTYSTMPIFEKRKVSIDSKDYIEYGETIDSFYEFASEMGELQDNVKVAMLTAQGDEAIRGNNRTYAQLYNFVARGGYNVLTEDANGDEKWLTQSEAKDIACTRINDIYAESTLGVNVPNLKVNTYKKNNEQASFFVTPKGNVFCWPPYQYSGKCYVDEKTVVTDLNKNELRSFAATREEKVQIYLEDTDETVIISNKSNVNPPIHMRGMKIDEGIGVWYYQAGAVEGIDFSQYYNTTTISYLFYGDVNTDYLINALDYDQLTKYLDGKSVRINKTNADVDLDGEITQNDAWLIYVVVNGEKVELPHKCTSYTEEYAKANEKQHKKTRTCKCKKISYESYENHDFEGLKCNFCSYRENIKITDSAYKKAAEELEKLEIIKGYNNGTIDPKTTVTRAEFAEILVKIKDLEAAANVSKGATRFADVPVYHYASGYINVVSQYGYMSGYSNGTFAPDEPITYDEAVAAVVKALGYGSGVEDDAYKISNFISKAKEINLLNNVSYNNYILKGNVIILVYNMIDTK